MINPELHDLFAKSPERLKSKINLEVMHDEQFIVL